MSSWDIPEEAPKEKPHKKKRMELKKAKETKEKVKLEKVKLETTTYSEETSISLDQPEDRYLLGFTSRFCFQKIL